MLCRILWYWRDVLVLRQDSNTETDWCMKSADFMNCDEHWSHRVWCYEHWSLHQRCMLRWSLVFVSRLVLWRCLTDSVLASSSAERCDVFQRLAKDSLYLFTILQCIFFSFASWSILDDIFFPPCGFSSGRVPRSVAACMSGMYVWWVSKGSSRNFEKFWWLYNWRPCGRSLSYLTSVWQSVSWVFSAVHCGEHIWVITLAGQSAVCDSQCRWIRD